MNYVESERAKYEKVYQFPNYGSRGHGAPIAHLLLARAKGRGTLGDFGCGRGGSFPPYIDAGFKIQPVDHVGVLDHTYTTHPAVLPLAVANLWADPLPAVEYGICTDVVEHIPEAHVADTIANIARAVTAGCLWTVCHVKDVWGDRIKDRLHMTVRPEPWWTPAFQKHWQTVEIVSANPGHTTYWTSH